MKKLKLLFLLALFCSLTLGCARDLPTHIYKDVTYDHAAKFNIDLSDRARFGEEGVLRISEAGAYRITGTASGTGQILVDAHPRAEVTLTLDGASLSGGDSAALYIKRAGRVRLVVADGSENLLSVGSSDSALRSEHALSVEGGGTLKLVSDTGDGMTVAGKLDLCGGDISITAKKTALRSEGTLTLLGAALKTDACSVGISAPSVKLTEGRADISAANAAFDSLSDILVEGGELLACVYNEDGGSTICKGGGVIRHTGGQVITLAEGHARFSEDTEINRINVTLSDVTSVDGVKVTDLSGEDVLLSDVSHLPASYLTVSSPVLVQGEVYRVWAGEINTKIPQDGKVAEKTVSILPAHMTKHTYAGLDYLVYTPAYVSEALPMLVFLHGSGEKGEDLDILTLAPSLPRFLAEGTLALDAYVIIPQCPSTETNWQSVTAKLEELIEHEREALPIIKDKVSLTGHSMGGNGVWVLAIRHPERYSKAAPLSGWVDLTDDNVRALSRIPIWDLVGELDRAVPPEESKPMTDALKAAGADVRVTMFEGALHTDIPTLAYLDEELGLMAWLLG